MASAVRAAASVARGVPARRTPLSAHEELAAARLRLDVVDRRLAASRSIQRRANVLRGLGVLFVVGALGVTAAAHTFVASDQQRIDTLQGQLTQALSEQQDLQLSRAELESPVRVLAIAQGQLGMVSPGSVLYLTPVDPGPSVAQAGADEARAASVVAAQTKAVTTKPAERGAKTLGRSSHAGARSSAITPPSG